MKVIYKSTMLDRIIDEIYEAKLKNKVIEKITLSLDEWEILANELRMICAYPDSTPSLRRGGQVAELMGVPIFVE